MSNYKIVKRYRDELILLGGDTLEKTKIDGNKYYYNITELSNDEKQLEYEFFVLEDYDIHKYIDTNSKEKGKLDDKTPCSLLLMDKTNKSANIQSVSNFSNCVYCKDKNNLYKVGDILMQIMIERCKKNTILKVNLHDNAEITSNKGLKFKLSFFRILTKGEAYYMKYGFIPTEKQDDVVYNIDLFDTKPKITFRILMEIIYDIKKNNSNNNRYDILLNNIFEEYKNMDANILVSKLINDLYNSEFSDILQQIYQKIFYKVGYKNIHQISYCLDLKPFYMSEFIKLYYIETPNIVKLSDFIRGFAFYVNIETDKKIIINYLETIGKRVFGKNIYGLQQK